MLSKLCRIAALSAICLSVAGGCGKKGGGSGGKASCEAVGDKFVKISRAAVERLEGKEKKQAEAMLSLLPKLKNDLVAECKKNEWSEKARKCMLAAKDEQEARVCRKHIDGGGSAKDLGESKKLDEPAKTGSTDTPPAAATSADTPPNEKKAAGGATLTDEKPATESPAADKPAAEEPTE